MNMIQKNNLYVIFVSISFILVGVLSWYVYDLRNKNHLLKNQLNQINKSVNSPISPQDPYFSTLKDSTINKKVNLPFLKQSNNFDLSGLTINNPYLLIFFTPKDCPYCFTESNFWEQISTVFRDQLNVVGIISDCEITTCKNFIKRENINIPVVLDKDEQLFKELKLDGNEVPRPVKVFINKNKKVLHRSTSTYNNVIKQINYTKTLQYLLGRS